MSKATSTITMSITTLAKLRDVAVKEKRTLSAQLEMMVERHFAEADQSADKPAEDDKAA